MSELPQEDVSEAARALADLQVGRDRAAQAEREERWDYIAARLAEGIAAGLAQYNYSRQLDEIFAADEANAKANGQAKAREPFLKAPAANGEAVALPTFKARPFVWRDPRTIKPRQWLHAKHYIHGFVSATIAPGGLGKSSLQLVEAVGMEAGRDLLRGTTAKMPLKVWYWNLEDPREEIDRRIAAILLHYNILPDETNGRLFVNSGRDEPLVVGEMQRGGAIVHLPVVEALKAEITRLGIDVLIIDPFVSCHRLPENDNGAIDAVVKTWAAIAEACNCSVDLAHHMRKPSNGSAGAEFDVN